GYISRIMKLGKFFAYASFLVNYPPLREVGASQEFHLMARTEPIIINKDNEYLPVLVREIAKKIENSSILLEPAGIHVGTSVLTRKKAALNLTKIKDDLLTDLKELACPNLRFPFLNKETEGEVNLSLVNLEPGGAIFFKEGEFLRGDDDNLTLGSEKAFSFFKKIIDEDNGKITVKYQSGEYEYNTNEFANYDIPAGVEIEYEEVEAASSSKKLPASHSAELREPAEPDPEVVAFQAKLKAGYGKFLKLITDNNISHRTNYYPKKGKEKVVETGSSSADTDGERAKETKEGDGDADETNKTNKLINMNPQQEQVKNLIDNLLATAAEPVFFLILKQKSKSISKGLSKVLDRKIAALEKASKDTKDTKDTRSVKELELEKVRAMKEIKTASMTASSSEGSSPDLEKFFERIKRKESLRTLTKEKKKILLELGADSGKSAGSSSTGDGSSGSRPIIVVDEAKKEEEITKTPATDTGVIKFYHDGQPYYEFTNFAPNFPINFPSLAGYENLAGE
ncbi:14612_t:CDS:2, partial [Ambispora leptoticha]